MEEKVLKSTLPLEVKEKILKDIKISKGPNTKEMERKIANSSVDLTIGEVAIKTQSQDLRKKGENYQKLLQEYKERQDKLNDFKEKSKQCKECQKYCSEHEKKSVEKMAKHETCSHCNKNVKPIQKVNQKIAEI